MKFKENKNYLLQFLYYFDALQNLGYFSVANKFCRKKYMRNYSIQNSFLIKNF